MSKLASSVESLEVHLKKLISNYQNLKSDYDNLEQEVNSKANSVSELTSEIERLKLEIKTLRTANAMLGSTEHKRETKLKINSLIKEIDTCIIQLAE